MAKRGELKTAMSTCIRFDEALAQKIKEGAELNERGWNQEVRYRLRQAYGLDQAPSEEPVGAA